MPKPWPHHATITAGDWSTPSQAEDTIITARLDLVIVQKELRRGDP
jgi:hypothetical protein